MRIPWKRIASVAVVVLALGFLAVLLRSQWAALQAYSWQIVPGWALLALAALEVSWLLELNNWRAILRSLGGNLPYRRTAHIWFFSNIIRYIPGNIWQFVGMAEMAAADGVPRVATFSGIVLHQAISTAAGLVLAALYFAVAGQGEWFERLRPFLWAVPIGLLLLHPRIFERILNGALVRLKRQPLLITLTWGQVWVLFFRYCFVWVVMGFSFAALVRALTPLTAAQWPYLAAAWAAAYVVGYLSMLTPSGLGVREGVIVLLLAPVMPESVAAVVAIVARLWMTAGELLGAGIAFADSRRQGEVLLVQAAQDDEHTPATAGVEGRVVDG